MSELPAQSPAPARSARCEWGWLGALALLLLVLYARGFTGGFVLDDRTYFVDNDLLPSLYPWDLKAIFLAPSNYWGELLPARDLLFVIEYRLFGERTVGYHVVSFLLYLGVGWLLYRLLVVLYADLAPAARRAPSAPLVATTFFLVHPVHVEGVAYISGQKDLLVALCSLGAMYLAYAGYRTGRLFHPRVLVPMLLCYYGAFLAKHVAVGTAMVIPALWVLAPRRPRREAVRALRGWVASTIPAALWLQYSLRAAVAVRGATFEMGQLALADRGFRAVRLLGAHTRLGLKPHPLHFGYPFEDATGFDGDFWIGCAVLLFAVGVVRARWRLGAAGAAIYLAYLFPILQLLYILPNAAVYDRYLFLPAAGMAILAERALHLAWRRLPGLRGGVVAVGAAAAIGLAALSGAYVPRFASDVAMARHGFHTFPAWRRSAFDYAYALVETGQLDEARDLARTAPALAQPTWVRPYFEGWILLERGEPAEAEPHLQRAWLLQVAGGYYPFAAIPYARLLRSAGRVPEARLLLTSVLDASISQPLERYRAKTMLAGLQSGPLRDLAVSHTPGPPQVSGPPGP